MCMFLILFHLSFYLTNWYILLQSQRAAKEEIEELKSIVVNTEENEEDQVYGMS